MALLQSSYYNLLKLRHLLSVTTAFPTVRRQPTLSSRLLPKSGGSIFSGHLTVTACRPCDTFNLNISPLCNLSSPRCHQGACPLLSLSWGPPQGWAHLLPQDYNGNLPSYIRSKEKSLQLPGTERRV